MLYLKCPTCRELLGNKQLIYEKEVKTIIDSNDSDESKAKRKMDLIAKIGLSKHRYCCKNRLITYTKLIDIVQ